MHTLSPTLDESIARKYGPKSLEYKVQNKVALQEELGWTPEPKRPILCLPCGMSDALGGKLLKEVLPGLLTLPVEILILGKGSASYGTLFTELTKEQGHRVAIIQNDEGEIRKMLAASDMALFLTDPTKQPELLHCMRYGVVPISASGTVLENYDQNQESGNAFVFDKPTAWHVFAAAVRAMETWRFPFDWRTIQRHCMESGE
jgi:starch synthase